MESSSEMRIYMTSKGGQDTITSPANRCIFKHMLILLILYLALNLYANGGLRRDSGVAILWWFVAFYVNTLIEEEG